MITATFMRRGSPIFEIELACSGYDNLERNTAYDYYEMDIPRRVDRTPDNGAGPDEAVTNSSHPNRGLEYYYDLSNELSIVLETDGDDMWVKDSIALTPNNRIEYVMVSTNRIGCKTQTGRLIFPQ